MESLKPEKIQRNSNRKHSRVILNKFDEKIFYFNLFVSLLATHKIIEKCSNNFSILEAGARGLAMGGAVISNQNDVYAPMESAGLNKVESDWQGAAMHAEYFESIAKYDYISFAKAPRF